MLLTWFWSPMSIKQGPMIFDDPDFWGYRSSKYDRPYGARSARWVNVILFADDFWVPSMEQFSEISLSNIKGILFATQMNQGNTAFRCFAPFSIPTGWQFARLFSWSFLYIMIVGGDNILHVICARVCIRKKQAHLSLTMPQPCLLGAMAWFTAVVIQWVSPKMVAVVH